MLPPGYFSKPAENNENAVPCYIQSNPSPTSNVYLRIKPRFAETNEKFYTVIGPTTFLAKKGESIDKKFTFTRIFDSEYSQADIFYHSLRQQVINFLLGENSTVLTYGASNSGKTYTLYGTPESPGIIPRAIEFVFSAINCTLAPWYKVTHDNRIIALNEYERTFEIQSKEDIINPKVIAKDEYEQARLSLNNSNPQISEVKERELCSDDYMSSVWISVAEIYNDNIYDLLIINDEEKRPLKITTRKGSSTYINNLKYVPITTALEACQLLVFVQSKMAVASTAVNDVSSRSHTLLTMKLLKYEKKNIPDEVRVSTLTFCDVAGSKRFRKREEKAARLTESRNINNSLLVLGRCLKSVRDSYCGVGYVAGPFRESKLTRILQKALTSREKVNFIITIDTEAESFAETLSVLNFSVIAKKLGMESRASKRNACSMSTPRSQKTSTLTSTTQTPENLGTVAFEEHETLKWQNNGLVKKLEVMQIADCKDQSMPTKVSKGTQSEHSFFNYKSLEEKRTDLVENLDNLECDSLIRELEIRQELADKYWASLRELEASWKKRAQDVEEEGRDLLEWSVNQVETFYKERIDSIMYSKKRKRNDGNNADGIQSICQELESENAMITSKVVVLREMVHSLRTENELLSTDRNKSNFELALIKQKLKGFHDLVRIHFPELFLKMQDNTSDSSCLVHELKCVFEEKTRNIEVLEKNLVQVRNDYVKMASKSIDIEKQLHDTKITLEDTSIKAKDFEHEAQEKTNHIHNLQLQLQLLRKELNNVRKCEIDCSALNYIPKEKYHSICNSNFFCSDNINSIGLATQAHVNTKAEHCFNYGNKHLPKKVSLNGMDIDMDRHTCRSSDNNIKEDSGIDFSCKSRRSTSIDDNSIIQETKENCTQTVSPLKDSNAVCKEMELLITDCIRSEQYIKQEENILFDKEYSDEANDMKSVINALKQFAEVNKYEVAECKSKLLSCETKMEELEEENKKLTKLIETDSQKYNERIKELTEELLIKEENENRYLNLLENLSQKASFLKNQFFKINTNFMYTTGLFSNLGESALVVEKSMEQLYTEALSFKGGNKDEKEEFSKLKLQLLENEREMDLIKKHRNDMIKKYECMVQHLHIEVEKKKEQLINLQKLLSFNYTWRCRKLSNKRRAKSMVIRLQKSAKSTNSDWKLFRVNKKVENDESFSSILEWSIANSRYAYSLNLQHPIKNTEFNTNSAYKTEESCPTENSWRLNDSNVDIRQIQSDASDCSEVRCGCGIGFKNARRQGRMSGWMKVRRSRASTDLLRQLDGEHITVQKDAFETNISEYHFELEEKYSSSSSN